MIVFLKEFLKKLILKNISRRQVKHEKLPSMQQAKVLPSDYSTNHRMGHRHKIDRQNIDTGKQLNVKRLTQQLGAQWLSGRVLDSRPRGHGFEPHRRHCVGVLEQDTFILA